MSVQIEVNNKSVRRKLFGYFLKIGIFFKHKIFKAQSVHLDNSGRICRSVSACGQNNSILKRK